MKPWMVRLGNCWCDSGLSWWDCIITSRRAFHTGAVGRLLAPLCRIGRHAWTVTQLVVDDNCTPRAWLSCQHCHKTLVLVAEPSFEHHDCLTTELSRDDEETLAELAAKTWPNDEEDYLRDALAHLHVAKGR